MKNRKIPITVLLSAETVAKIEVRAKQNDTSISTTARTLIEKGLESA